MHHPLFHTVTPQDMWKLSIPTVLYRACHHSMYVLFIRTQSCIYTYTISHWNVVMTTCYIGSDQNLHMIPFPGKSYRPHIPLLFQLIHVAFWCDTMGATRGQKYGKR